MLLNGRFHDGSKASFELGFKYARYAIVLLAAITMPSFRYHTKTIQNTNVASYYNLYKVAKILGLEFERNRAAPKAYDELTQRGYVKIIRENSRTFITFTEEGKRNCEEILEHLQLLNDLFNSNLLVQQRYKEGANERQKMVKGIYSSSQRRLEIETEIDRLIRKISQW